MSAFVDMDEGGVAEEALRRYFLGMGSFVVRGVPLREGDEGVSDVDLWVYTRVSAYARQISIVDVKNRKRARGFERILWVKGLQAAMKADEAIVATSDARDALTPFASRVGVRVLTSQPLRAIAQRFSSAHGRLSGEELHAVWRTTKYEGVETIQSRVERSLSWLARGISFAALNSWLDDAIHFLNVAFEKEAKPDAFTRAAYFCASLAALGADFLGREVAFAEAEARRDRFKQGLLFGGSGPNMGKDLLDFAEAAATEFLDPTGAAAATIRKGVEEKMALLPVEGLAEFFTRPAAGRELLDGALALEAATFATEVPKSHLLRPEAKAVLGALLDYAGMPRGGILGARIGQLALGAEQQSIPFHLDALESDGHRQQPEAEQK